jgi:hypothetical protein
MIGARRRERPPGCGRNLDRVVKLDPRVDQDREGCARGGRPCRHACARAFLRDLIRQVCGSASRPGQPRLRRGRARERALGRPDRHAGLLAGRPDDRGAVPLRAPVAGAPRRHGGGTGARRRTMAPRGLDRPRADHLRPSQCREPGRPIGDILRAGIRAGEGPAGTVGTVVPLPGRMAEKRGGGDANRARRIECSGIRARRHRRASARHEGLRSAGPGQPRGRQRPVADGSGRQDLRPRRPVRLRQDDHAEDGQPPHRAHRRPDPH